MLWINQAFRLFRSIKQRSGDQSNVKTMETGGSGVGRKSTIKSPRSRQSDSHQSMQSRCTFGPCRGGHNSHPIMGNLTGGIAKNGAG
jgi:hypothetical protein